MTDLLIPYPLHVNSRVLCLKKMCVTTHGLTFSLLNNYILNKVLNTAFPSTIVSLLPRSGNSFWELGWNIALLDVRENKPCLRNWRRWYRFHFRAMLKQHVFNLHKPKQHGTWIHRSQLFSKRELYEVANDIEQFLLYIIVI